MDLKPEFIDYLKALVNGEMEDLETFKAWWDEHYQDLKNSVPIWMLIRFEQGGKLCAEVTLNELGISTNSDSTEPDLSLDDPYEMLKSLKGAHYPQAFRRFSVFCAQAQSKWLCPEWLKGIEDANAFANDDISETEWQSECERLTEHFWEIRESDAGEITAAKQAVLACFDPNPFCAAVTASTSSSASIFFETGDEDCCAEEEARQVDVLRDEIARAKN